MLPIYHFCVFSTFSNCNGDVVKCIVGKMSHRAGHGEKTGGDSYIPTRLSIYP